MILILKKLYFCRRFKKLLAMSEILEKVQTIIADKLSIDVTEVTLEKSFSDDLGADSLDTAELVLDFENAFDIKIAEDQAETIVTVQDAVTAIEKLLAEK